MADLYPLTIYFKTEAEKEAFIPPTPVVVEVKEEKPAKKKAK